jgi:hypothetical protein
MKKITILSILIFLVLTSLSFAAQKTIIQYLRAGDMDTQMPVPDTDFVFTGTPGAIIGDLSTITGTNSDGTPTRGTLSFGNNLLNSSGSYWYGGDADICYCVDGKCKFGIGVRIYYEFRITTTDSSSDSTAQADGYGFSIVNGTYNSKTSTGGAPAGISMGELLGYAGPGRSDSLGLRPPKMGIEFDTYPNYGGTSDICTASTRNDPTDNKNHMALMYWGDNPSGSCTIGGTSYPKATFDDNRHGTGGGSGYPPANSNKSDGTGGFYAGAKNGSYNWLEDNTLHRFRLEIIRAVSPNVDGTYSYTTKAWVDCAGCSDSQLATFKDLTVAYSDLTPQITRTVTLTAADHQAFDTMLFGWSEATGLYTQTIKFQNFNMYCTKSTCAYGTKPLSASYDQYAHSGNSFNAYAGAGCAWTAASNDISWITGVTPASGTSNGTITYNVAANTGIARTGTISIGDELFTISQANGCTTPSLSATSASVGAGASSGNTVGVTVGTGCPWTAASNDAWITVTSGTNYTGGGTVTYNVSANTGLARTGTITIAGQTFTVNQSNGCSYSFGSCPGTFQYYGGTATISVTTATGCTWTSSDNRDWISTSPTSSSGSGNVTVTVSGHDWWNGYRSGTVTITGTMGSANTKSCTIGEW